MPASHDQIEKRKNAALAAIKAAFGTEDDEYGATLFVSHHLEEIDESYWQKHLSTARPEPARVFDLLELRSPGIEDDDDDDFDTFDFTLPGNVTDYVLSVRFDEAGKVEEISMES
ncbi:MAG: DUF2004 domain-containing protein [Betaproteobacteria bacterium]